MSVGWNDCQCFLNEEAVTGMTPSEVSSKHGSPRRLVFFFHRKHYFSGNSVPTPACLGSTPTPPPVRFTCPELLSVVRAWSVVHLGANRPVVRDHRPAMLSTSSSSSSSAVECSNQVGSRNKKAGWAFTGVRLENAPLQGSLPSLSTHPPRTESKNIGGVFVARSPERPGNHSQKKRASRARVMFWQILGASGVLSETAGAFFYDQDLKLIDSLADEEVSARLPRVFHGSTSWAAAESLITKPSYSVHAPISLATPPPPMIGRRVLCCASSSQLQYAKYLYLFSQSPPGARAFGQPETPVAPPVCLTDAFRHTAVALCCKFWMGQHG